MVNLIGKRSGAPIPKFASSSRQLRLRTSESKGHWQLVDFSAAFEFEVPNRICRDMIGTSNPPHWSPFGHIDILAPTLYVVNEMSRVNLGSTRYEGPTMTTFDKREEGFEKQ